MTYLSLFLFLSALVAVIYKEAVKDNNTIKEHRKVNHVKVWLARAGIMVYVSFLAWSIIAHGNDFDLMPLLGFLLMSAFGFSALFRLKLNSLRGKGWWYMGPYLDDRTKKDAWYDGLFHRFARFIARSPASAYYPRCLPATLAYIAESIAFAGGLYLVIKPLIQ